MGFVPKGGTDFIKGGYMKIAKIVLIILFVILGIALSAIILMQEGKGDGIGALAGQTDT